LHAPVWTAFRHETHVASALDGGEAHAVAAHAVSQLPGLHAHDESASANALYASVCAV
jgi:hypothetical protein